jgi:uncharacterized protein (TIGR03000 family)
MIKSRWFYGLAFSAVCALATDQAVAHHSHGSYGSCGSSGGSYGSYGSSGGSHGSHGSSGGSWGSHGSSGGSWGSHGSNGGSSGGSSGGSWGSHGSSGGSWGSHGSCGSSGGSYGSYGSNGGGMAMTAAPAEAPMMAATTDDRGHLTLTVPADATVYLCDQPMTLTGSVRTYAIPGLTPGRDYVYPVRVEVTRSGQLYRATAEPRVRAGGQMSLVFNDAARQTQAVASN